MTNITVFFANAVVELTSNAVYVVTLTREAKGVHKETTQTSRGKELLNFSILGCNQVGSRLDLSHCPQT